MIVYETAKKMFKKQLQFTLSSSKWDKDPDRKSSCKRPKNTMNYFISNIGMFWYLLSSF